MKKSTLTALLGFVLLIGAGILTVSNFQDQTKNSEKKAPSLLVKTADKASVSKEKKEPQEPETVTVQFGLNANFGPKPETETEQ